MALTDLKIKKAKAKEKPYKLYDSLGLFVLMKPNGSKLWRQKYQLDFKERTIAHGSYPVVSLRDARNKRDEIRDQIAAGNDPAVQERLDQIEAETQARNTFLLVAEEYLQMAHDRELADATMRKKIWHVHTLAESLHHRPINEITSAEILHLLKKVEHSGRRETAKKLRGTLSGIFRLAVVTLRAENDPTYAVKGALLLIGQFDDVVGQTLFIGPALRHLALRGPMLAERAAGPAFRYVKFPPHVVDAFPATRRAQKFPFAASVRMSLSSVRSDTARRSRWFYFSSSFRRLSCERPIPPYNFRHR